MTCLVICSIHAGSCDLLLLVLFVAFVLVALESTCGLFLSSIPVTTTDMICEIASCAAACIHVHMLCPYMECRRTCAVLHCACMILASLGLVVELMVNGFG